MMLYITTIIIIIIVAIIIINIYIYVYVYVYVYMYMYMYIDILRMELSPPTVVRARRLVLLDHRRQPALGPLLLRAWVSNYTIV